MKRELKNLCRWLSNQFEILLRISIFVWLNDLSSIPSHKVKYEYMLWKLITSHLEKLYFHSINDWCWWKNLSMYM